MRRALLVLLGLMLPLPLAPAAHADLPDPPPRYKAYVVCSAKTSAEPATTCGRNKPKTAVFLSKDRDAVYKVCVKFPTGQKLCAAQQVADKGVRSGVSITSDKVGTHKITWFVGGEKVGTYRFDVKD